MSDEPTEHADMRIQYEYRAVECLGGLYQPQVCRHIPGETMKRWRNVGRPTNDKSAAEASARDSACRIAATY
mgnify:CR=1 FL=1